jgi:hypothetical protein
MADIGLLDARLAHLDQVLTRMPAAKCLFVAVKRPDFHPAPPFDLCRGVFNFGQFVPINRMFNRRC